MSNFNKVISSFQKIKGKNLGQNQEKLVHYLVKDCSFSNDEAEILIVDAVKANAIKSVMFNGKTSYRIVKTDNECDTTVLFPDIQEKHQRISPLKMLLFLMKLMLSQQQVILRQTPYQMNKK